MNESHQLIHWKKIIVPANVVAISAANERRMLQLIFSKINHGSKSKNRIKVIVRSYKEMGIVVILTIISIKCHQAKD